MSRNRVLEAFAAALQEDDPQALYDRAPCGYLSATADGTVLKANQTFTTMTGLGRDRWLGRSFTELLTPAGRVLHETHVVPTLRLRGEVRELAVDLLCADAEPMPVLLNAMLERDELGAPSVVRFALFDATERRRYERELVRSATLAQEAQRAAEDAAERTRGLVDTLQGSLVPRTLPEVAGLGLAGVYRPAGDGGEVGGDFYDVFVQDDECWVVLGDVSGKGVEAAVVTGLVRDAARALADALPASRREPAEVLRRLDRLVGDRESSRFCTVAVLRWRRAGESWNVSYASAGHPPLVLKPAGQDARWVVVDGVPLGMSLDLPFDQVELTLRSGDLVLLVTDGVTEAPDGSGGLYGESHFLQRVSRVVDESDADPAALVDALLGAALDLQGGRPRDDIASLAVGVVDPRP